MLGCNEFAYAQSNNESKRIDKKALKQGAEVYEKYGCSACHAKDGVGIGKLTEAYVKYSDEELRSYIQNPREYNNDKMPVYREIIPESDYDLLMPYIRWLGQISKEKE